MNCQLHCPPIRNHFYLLPSAAAQCPPNFFESEGLCFKMIDKPEEDLTWEECRGLCEKEAEGEWKADLAVFDNAEELEEFCITWLGICEYYEYFSDPRCVYS